MFKTINTVLVSIFGVSLTIIIINMLRNSIIGSRLLKSFEISLVGRMSEVVVLVG